MGGCINNPCFQAGWIMLDYFFPVSKKVDAPIAKPDSLRILAAPLFDNCIYVFKIPILSVFRSEFYSSCQGNMEGVTIVAAGAFEPLAQQSKKPAYR